MYIKFKIFTRVFVDNFMFENFDTKDKSGTGGV